MQRYFTLIWPIIFFFIMLFAYTKLAGPIPFQINSVTTTKSDAFQVTGEGKVEASPDLATINVGVNAQGSTVKAAQDELNANINKVSGAVKALGVDSKDIQTSNYNINPATDFTSPNQRITGYTANTNLTIKIRDINKVNGVIDAATAAGANQVGGVQFDVADRTKLENQAREMAVKNAKDKATQAAKIGGFSLGRLVNYQEGFEGQPVPMLRAAQGSADKAQIPTQVEPGQNEISVNVTLSYEIR